MELENSSTESQTVAPVESADTSAEFAQHTDSQSEGSDTAQEQPRAEPKHDPIQKRFDQLTYQRHEAERRANEFAMQAQQAAFEKAALERRVAEFEALQRLPDASMFASEEHARAFYAQAQEAERQRTAQFEQQRQQQMQMLQAQQAEATRRAYVAANNEALIAAGTAKYPDFEKVVNNPQLPDITQAHPAVLQTFYGSEKRAEIAYFLSKNPAEAHKLAAMQPVQQIAELGRIEARLSRAAISNATPQPLSAVPGQATPRSAALDGLSTSEFIKRRNEAERRRLGGR